MKIYHYTSIETLSLILDSKNIRFSRLDTVDDPEEYGFKYGDYEPAKHVFVSCWTTNQHESIPQWIIYGNNKHGVRIEVDDDLFEINRSEHFDSLPVSQSFRGKDIIIAQFPHQGFLSDIIYVDSPQNFYLNMFKNVNGKPAFDYKEIGLYKSNDWAFQKECRFKLIAFPKTIEAAPLAMLDYVFENNRYIDMSFIDFPVKTNAFEGMKITLGPEVSKAEEIVVRSLCEKYLNMYEIQSSIFSRP